MQVYSPWEYMGEIDDIRSLPDVDGKYGENLIVHYRQVISDDEFREIPLELIRLGYQPPITALGGWYHYNKRDPVSKLDIEGSVELNWAPVPDSEFVRVITLYSKNLFFHHDEEIQIGRIGQSFSIRHRRYSPKDGEPTICQYEWKRGFDKKSKQCYIQKRKESL